MKRPDGTEYKEGTVKTICNISAKLVQKKFYEEVKRETNPFRCVIFEDAKKARAAKRKKLQAIPEERERNSVTLKAAEISKIVSFFDENTPDGLQKKFYQIYSVELAWRGNEAVFCLVYYFKAECDHYCQPTGRIEYNTIFSKIAQCGEKYTAESK
ncbi:hypothetical protein QE152_g37874 [Popillia japonica]|uniref:Uncharacterized protein n=1 Tax=Popillia japonica TaxID=7064 RepID=A0AAW1I8N1_POPJA